MTIAAIFAMLLSTGVCYQTPMFETDAGSNITVMVCPVEHDKAPPAPVIEPDDGDPKKRT